MRIQHVAGFIILFAVLISGYLFDLYGDWLWYSSVGYSQVWSTIVVGSLTLGMLTGLGFLGFSFLNIFLARKRVVKGKKKPNDGLLFWLAGVFALIIGSGFSDWSVWLRFLNPTDFPAADPVFAQNIGFYVFTMPFYGFLLSYAMVTIVLTGLLVLGSYAINSGKATKAKEEEPSDDTSGMEFMGSGFEAPSLSIDLTGLKEKSTPHLSILLAMVMIGVSFAAVMAQWGLLYSDNGAVFGAAFTDLNVTVYVFSLISIISLVLAALLFVNARIKRWRLLLEGSVALVGVAIIGFIAVGVTQAFIVEPDEFNVESPYIDKNIQHTLSAYGLAGVETDMFPVYYNLTVSDIEENPGTVNNIRLWDWRPLSKTYNQLQLFRTYYEFNDVDIDRYNLDGDYKQVMVSAREMNTMDLPSNARSWINEHMVYTHGYGFVMNPVDSVTPEGLPEFFVQDIPPRATYGSLEVDRPEIYFGEDTWNYVITKTTTEELDYPSGDKNIYTTYEGDTGVALSDPLSRLVYAAKFGSIELLVSNSITQESRVMLYRDILTRARKITPFLAFDSDPYVVASEGRIYWILDAYTITDKYPYSEPVMSNSGPFNYIRNSVKVIIDAYSGDLSFYVVDDEDPLIQTYQKIFPGVFSEFSEMPNNLRQHVRYPEDLFSIQSSIYSVYHMTDPRVFYNKEDMWVIPDEVYRGSRQKIDPYYVIIEFPGEDKEEFVIMVPFTPRGKENLIGWMAARCDEPNYGEKQVFQFSKQELVYGPMQIEARIDQDTDISQLFTLWGQAGSSVLRGNTLVIPVEDSILYIEPVYLEATERGTLPELKRVIVAYGNRLTMKETLQEALDVIFGMSPGDGGGGPSPGETSGETVARIAELYERAQDALQDGNLGLYQRYVDQIGELVKGI